MLLMITPSKNWQIKKMSAQPTFARITGICHYVMSFTTALKVKIKQMMFCGKNLGRT